MAFTIGPLPGISSLPAGSFAPLGPGGSGNNSGSGSGEWGPLLGSTVSQPTTASNNTPQMQTGAPSLVSVFQDIFSLFQWVTNLITAGAQPGAPKLWSPNEIFDGNYWNALIQNANAESYAESNNNSLIGELVGTAVVATAANEIQGLETKYGPGGESNYITLLTKFGTEILFGIIILILIWAFLSGEGETT